MMNLATTIITPEQMYWITRMDGISDLFEAIVVAFIGITIVLTVVTGSQFLAGVYGEEERKLFSSLKKGALISFLITFVFATLYVLTPTTKTVFAIYGVPKILNNETLQKDASDIYNFSIDYIKETLKPKGENK